MGLKNGKMWILVKFHAKFYISIATTLIYIERVKVCFLPIVTLSNFDCLSLDATNVDGGSGLAVALQL